MKFYSRTDYKALGYTLLVHLLLLLLLLLWKLRQPDLLSSVEMNLEGIPVQIGYMEAASGNDNLVATTSTPAPPAQPTATSATSTNVPRPSRPQPAPPIMTQPNRSVPIPNNTQRDAEAKARAEAEARRQREEAQRKAEEQAREAARRAAEEQARNAARGRVAGRFENTNTDRGDRTGTGTQGTPTGNSQTGATSGVPGYGDVSLAGRRLEGTLPKPAYPNNEVGNVAVQITVNASGEVIAATVRTAGTNTSNAALRNAALAAARKARFNAQKDAPNQTGLITYRFVLN